MKHAASPGLALVGFVVAIALLGAAPRAGAQTGAIEFTARIIPAAGTSEPVRGLPFYLLTKSYQDIRREAEETGAKPELDGFIDKLNVSKELKAWMKGNHSVSLTGDTFIKSLTPSDIMDVPEFFKAYLDRNSADQSVNFPQPKYKEKDKDKNPARYEKLQKEYLDTVRKFLTTYPATADGIDLGLASIDPAAKWQDALNQREKSIQHLALELAQTKYLAGRTETSLDGRGGWNGITPGNYWLSTLEIYAEIGDARLRWDTPVVVSSGQTTRAELSNANAAEPHGSAP